MKQKNSKKNRGFALILAVLFCVIGAFTAFVVYTQIKRTPKAQTTTAATSAADEDTNSSYVRQSAQKTDAAAYYRAHSEKLLAVVPVKTSSQVYSEKRIGKELSARGFGKDFPITYEYTMNGSFETKTEIDTASAATHPQYSVLYQTQRGDYWTVSVCNDCISAYPVTYNLEHNRGTELIIIEGKSITAYDSETNRFYESIPKPDVLQIKSIPAITAQALEQLTVEELNSL